MKGKAKCILCTKVITCGGRGLPSLSDHMKTENHVRNVVIKENYRLPGTSYPVHEHGGMYGVFGSGDGIIITKNPSTVSCAYS